MFLFGGVAGNLAKRGEKRYRSGPAEENRRFHAT
jgi:hypothetical protein